MSYTEDAIVSSDILGDPHTSIFDATAGIALTGNFMSSSPGMTTRWGYSNKVVMLIEHMASVDAK